MYKIRLTTNKVSFLMPAENHESLAKACYLADLYQKRNKTAHFTVETENGDAIYETEPS